jgi:hypothetical protein
MASRQRKKRRTWAYEHDEHRTKVTLADFYKARLNAIDIPYGSIANAALYGCPVDRPRAKTKDLVPFSDKTLTRLCKPLSTPTASEFKPQTVAPWQKMPRYVDWLKSIGAYTPKPKAKRKPKVAPMFQDSKPERWRNFPMEDIPCFTQS